MALETDLVDLLTVWRRTRHPRVADALDRVSNELADQRGPIGGKSVAAMLEHAVKLAQGKDPADLGRVTRLKWPGTWQKGLPVLEAVLAAFPDDPRVDVFLATTFAHPPWTSHASWGFFVPLHAALAKATDSRIVKRLEEGDARAQPYWYRNRLQERVRTLLNTLRAATPAALSKAELARLEPIEARYRDDLHREKEKATGEKDLLTTIYAQPANLQARAVFADWLSERNDPRGECIALQLAPERTRPQQARLAQLIKKHGTQWAGGLDGWFAKDQRLFEHGFLVGGRLLPRGPRPFEESFTAEPLWKLVHTVEQEWRHTPRAELFPQLKALHGTTPDELLPLLGTTRYPLEELSLEVFFVREEVGLAPLGNLPSFPKLRTLGLGANRHLAEWFPKLKVLERITTLRLRDSENLSKTVAAVRRSYPNITRVEVISGDGWLFPDGKWRVTLSRGEGGGPFTRVEAYTTQASVLELIALLTEPAKVESLRIEAGRTLPLRAAELQTATQQLAAFKQAEIEVPWERAPAAKPAVKAGTGEKLDLTLRGGALLSKDMGPLWKHLVEGGLVFDAYNVGYGDAHRPLKGDPGEVLSRWGANARCQRLELYRDGGEDRFTLGRARDHWPANSHLEFRWNGRSSDAFLVWLDGLFGLAGDARVAWLDGAGGLPTLFGADTGTGRLIAYGGELRAQLPEKKFVAAVKKAGGFVHVGQHALVFGPGRFDQKASTASLERLRDVLWPLVIEGFTARTGVDFEAQVKKLLVPAAQKLGFALAEPEGEPGWLELRLVRGKFQLKALLHHLLATSYVRFELTHPIDKSSHRRVSLGNAQFDAKAFPALLRTAVELLETEGARFLEDPAGFKPKRR